MTRILVADDDTASSELLTYFLHNEGFEVETAGDGNRAVDLGMNGGFDLIILDFHMPLYDGGEVLEMLRKRHLLHPVKVIALTADESVDVRRALDGGKVDAFLTKPVDLKCLRQEIDRVLAA